MNRQRIAIGVLVCLVCALGFQNVRMNTQIDTLRSELVGSTRAEVVMGDATGAVSAAMERSRPGDQWHRGKAGRSKRGEGRWDGRRGSNHHPMRGKAGAQAVTVGVGENQPDGSESTDDDDDDDNEGNQGRDWGAIRDDMESGTVNVIDSMADREGWSPETTDEVMAIMLDAHDDIGELWRTSGEEGRSRYQTFKEMREIREAVGDDVSDILGEEAYDLLAEELWESRQDVFRNHGSGN